MRLELNVNGTLHQLDTEPRRLLSDVLRHEVGCYGVHLGCEHGACGACTVLLDGMPVCSCLMLAAQAEGHEVITVEGLGGPEDLHPVQRAFAEEHGLQCGFCTPGLVLAVSTLVSGSASMDDSELREALSGNVCRCTGYVNIVKAVRRAETLLAELESRVAEKVTT